MNRFHLRFFQRRAGREVRAWPALALLLLIVLTAIGCVLWFMREAVRNERMAVRQKIAEAYGGQLELIRQRAEERWERELAALDVPEPGPAAFARAVREGRAESVIVLDEERHVVYPGEPRETEKTGAESEALQSGLRALVRAGQIDGIVQYVQEKFASAPASVTLDARGRLVSANAELLALELLRNPEDTRFQELAGRLRRRLNDYETTLMPSAQRHFLMRGMQRLIPSAAFPLLEAEELAARALEEQPAPEAAAAEPLTDGPPGIWRAASPGGRALALFTTAGLRSRLTAAAGGKAPSPGTILTVIPPGGETSGNMAFATAAAGPRLPGWRIALTAAAPDFYHQAAEERITSHLWIGALVTAAMAVLGLVTARGFGRQVRLARLKNDLVATVSHELKTPLTSMRALVDTLLQTERLDEAVTRDYLALFARENSRLSRLIDNFLTFSRLEGDKLTFHFAPLRPRSVVDAALAAMRERTAAAGAGIECVHAENPPLITGDADALVTALLNLLDNAWKYSGGTGRITLRTEAADGAVRFIVEDQGIGLSPAETRRVFRRFHQVDQKLSRAAGGCGLGLSIVQSIVEAHGGSVRVVSEPGVGSAFTLEIPAVPAAPEMETFP